IGKHFGLYDNALFHTEVKDLEWDEARSRWIIRTSRGDEFTAQFVATGIGPLHVPKLPGIPGDPVPPARDRPPSYPPWPGSPAAGG
ncbi:MAG TPA: hypothetical protein VH307_22450, partial [Streptosporangiaceae bacterium]|nr:hypothetical protein [Streptosporangiaceae bacterium]